MKKTQYPIILIALVSLSSCVSSSVQSQWAHDYNGILTAEEVHISAEVYPKFREMVEKTLLTELSAAFELRNIEITQTIFETPEEQDSLSIEHIGTLEKFNAPLIFRISQMEDFSGAKNGGTYFDPNMGMVPTVSLGHYTTFKLQFIEKASGRIFWEATASTSRGLLFSTDHKAIEKLTKKIIKALENDAVLIPVDEFKE